MLRVVHEKLDDAINETKKDVTTILRNELLNSSNVYRDQVNVDDVNTVLERVERIIGNMTLDFEQEPVRWETYTQCDCFDDPMSIPFIPHGFNEDVDAHVIAKCNGGGGFGLVLDHLCRGVVQFGCDALNNSSRCYIYGHVASGRVRNITFVMDRRLAHQFKRYVFGTTCFSLYKSKIQCTLELLPLVQLIPHIELCLGDKIRNDLINVCNHHKWENDNHLWIDVMRVVYATFGSFLQHSIERDLFPCVMSVQQDLILTMGKLVGYGDTSLSRLETLNIPEMLYFTDVCHTAFIEKCIKNTRERFAKTGPYILTYNYQTSSCVSPCGAETTLGEMFLHPCFAPYLAIEKVCDIRYPRWNKQEAN